MFRTISFAVCLCALLVAAQGQGALVGHWEFDDVNNLGLDSQGGNNNGTQQGTDTSFSFASRVGSGALAVDGTGTGLRVANPVDFQTLTTFTIASFIKPDFDNPRFDNGAGVIGRVFGALGIDGAGGTQFGPNDGYGFGARADGGVRFTTYGVRDFDVLGSTLADPLQSDEWAHIAVTVTEPGLANFYINGVHVGTIDDARNPTPSVNPYHIGVSAIGDTDPFAGLIDDLRVYNEALDAAAIAALANPAGQPSRGLALTINRDTGEAVLENATAGAISIAGYSVLSSAGALNPGAWDSLSDVDPNWVRLSETAEDLSEGAIETAALAAGQSVNAGSVWLKGPFEDLAVEFLLDNGSTVQGSVEFTGNNDQSFKMGDLDFDNSVDLADFALLNANLFSDKSLYVEGDLNRDGSVDEFDFLLFKDSFVAEGGSAAALADFQGAVPEPGTLFLAMVGLVGAGCLSIRRARATFVALFAVAIVGLASSVADAQLVPLFEYRFPASNDGSTTHVDDLSPAGNDGTTNVQNAGPAFEMVADIPAGEPSTNRALDYSNTYGQIITNTNSILNNPAIEAAGGYTYDLWFNPQDAGADMNGNRKIIDYAGTEWIAYRSNGPGNLPTLRLSIGNGTFFQELQTGFDPNGWNHIRYIFDSSGNTIAENGSLAGDVRVILNDTVLHMGTGTKTNFGDTLDRPLSLGRHPTGDSEHYRGLLYNPSVYLGAVPFEDAMVLQVNTSTGAVVLAHESSDYYPDAREIDFYKIESADGSLVVANWSSLEEQGFDGGVSEGDFNGNGSVENGDLTLLLNNWGSLVPPTPAGWIGDAPSAPGIDNDELTGLLNNWGNTGGGSGAWVEVGSPSENAIGESFLTGSSAFDDGLTKNLGNIFEVGGAQDLVFTYHVVGQSEFHTGRVVYNGAGAASQAVPEPGTLAMVLLGVVGFALGRRRTSRVTLPLLLAAFVGIACQSAGAVEVDRLYRLGEGAGENGSVGAILGSGNSFGNTFDDVGTPDAGDLQDLSPFDFATQNAGPTYVDVSNRPLAGTGSQLGAKFDGDGDYLVGIRLGLPATTQSGTAGVPPGPHDYSGITHRGLQFWANPLDSALGQGTLQSVLVDTTQHGVLISPTGTWMMKYRNVNFDSGVPVATGEGANGWSHVMLVQPHGSFGGGSILYVDGVAVTAGGNGYVPGDNAPLVVGSNTAVDASGNFTGGTTDFYSGIVDDVEMFVLGTSIATNTNYGSFNFAVDNHFAADALAGVVPGDLTGDGQVSGDGSGSPATDDVAAFITNWGFEKVLNNRTVGDLATRDLGDFNFDGTVDLYDWDILRGAHAGGASLDLNALLSGGSIPEPTTLGMLVLALVSLVRVRSSRR